MFGLKRRPKKQAYYHIESPKYWVQGKEILDETHTLIAGSTRCGKSTLIHKLMWTALAYVPGKVQFILIDMKEGVEMMRYQNLPHVLRFADTEQDAIKALDYAIEITRARLKEMKAQGIVKYEGSDIYVVIDELGFLLQACGNEALDRLTLLGRIAAAARVHLIMATQDPSRKGCPSAIQVNCTCLIGMKCRDAQQSRQIIGMAGCESLPRYGTAFIVRGSEISTMSITPKPEEVYQERINYWNDPNKCIIYE
jgi:DNA segregation ATPase FtsK/SpoIIIE-like protein